MSENANLATILDFGSHFGFIFRTTLPHAPSKRTYNLQLSRPSPFQSVSWRQQKSRCLLAAISTSLSRPLIVPTFTEPTLKVTIPPIAELTLPPWVLAADEDLFLPGDIRTGTKFLCSFWVVEQCHLWQGTGPHLRGLGGRRSPKEKEKKKNERKHFNSTLVTAVEI